MLVDYFFVCISQDWNRTWYTDDPDLTVCFEKTVLVWIPCAFLWLAAGLDIYYALISRARNVPWSPLNVAKITVIVLLMILQLLELAYSFYKANEGYVVYDVEKYTPITRIITFVSPDRLMFFLLWNGRILMAGHMFGFYRASLYSSCCTRRSRA